MPPIRKPLSKQVILITGASSGIGLATARRAAERGASVVLVSRDGPELERIAKEIEDRGGHALAAPADVSDEAALERACEAAVARFGRVDTWVNDAGIASYADLVDLPIAEHRRIFETNYWGVVHGSLIAVRRFRRQPDGGRIVNLGSLVSDIAVPLLSAYSASKHAVKGFTNALRRELIASDPAISVSLIKPAGIATAFPQHARNHMQEEPRVTPPLYEPAIVAGAILDAAETGRREIAVGAVGATLRLPATLFPNLMDRLLAFGIPPLSKSSNPRTRRDNLDEATANPREHYAFAPGLPFSPYTELQKRPALALGLLALGVAALARRAGRRRHRF